MKFISDGYFQMYQALHLFTSSITLNINIFTNIKVIKNTCTHIYTSTKVIDNAKLDTAWVQINCSEFWT